MTMFAIYLGGIRVYETSDAAALERGGLTPIVVDFVYRRRVAEVLLDFVLVTVSYYAAYRLKFDFIEFAANFTYLHAIAAGRGGGAARVVLRGRRLSGRVATFQRVGRGHRRSRRADVHDPLRADLRLHVPRRPGHAAD